jgi:acetyltransferase
VDVHRLDCIFKPQRIALWGATENPLGVGCTVLRNLVGGGFRGVVYPVQDRLEAVLGIHCYPDAHHLPHRPDLAVICTAAPAVPAIVRQCGEAGILGIVIVSAGFREIGPAGHELEEQIRAEARRFDGMRIIGPNCLGIIVPGLSLNASFAAGMPKPGRVAFVSQSGALCTSVLDWAQEENVGFSYFVSIGNTLDVDFGDLVDYFGEDPQTDSVILYIESLRDARRFMSATRAFARSKPIVAYKAGRFAESAQAAASHTGALAGEDAVYQAAFDRAGIARVHDIGSIFDCAELVARYPPPQGPRLAIVTNAGGPGVMATDALIARHGVLAQLAPATLAALDEALPPYWSHGNPIDVLGDARPKRVAKAVELALGDANVDAVLVILTPQAMTNPSSTARAVGELKAEADKPVLAAWLGGRSMREGIQILNQAGVATYATPEEAVGAFMTLVAYARNLEALFETPRDIPVRFTLDRAALRRRFEALVPPVDDILTEGASKELLQAYGIPVSAVCEARSADEAAGLAAELGWPVVLKVLSPDITHKSDVGGVVLSLRDEAAVRDAFARIVSRARILRPDARVLGVSVQRMVEHVHGFELLLGSKQDATFGAVILAGMGGVAAEVYGDRALGLPPLNERLARRMLESLTSWPLLRGYRGRPGADLDRLVEILMRFSYLVADHPEIREIDVNPLLVTPDDVVALDARVILDRTRLGAGAAPYSHLVLRPYPEEYVRAAQLRAGTPVLLRPIKPEDEPRWTDMLARCSPETIYARFRGHVAWGRHDIATRYCFIDYDREIAIVAEHEAAGERQLLGVGRLIADPDHETVEYAVLVTDAWQDRGLGGVLTDYCWEIAQRWGLARIVAETHPTNHRMLALFRNRGYTLRPDPAGEVVEVVKELPRGAPAPAR